MDTSHLFTAALRLQSPWKVGSVDFRDADGGRQELHIMIGFEPGVFRQVGVSCLVMYFFRV